MKGDSEVLVGLSDDELEALADGLLSPSAQAHLNDLLDRNAEGQLAAFEQVELDRLLARVDQLTTLKTLREIYTGTSSRSDRGVSAYVPAELRQQVRDLFLNRCAYCQTVEELTVTTFEVEHIIPRSAGGNTALTNLCFACPTCNRCKADRTAAIDPATHQEFPLYRPQHDDWSAHFAWNDDATEIVASTPTGRATIAALRMNRPQLIRQRRMWIAMGEHPPKS